MVSVFSASSTIEAHLVKNLLEQHGIEAHVAGHYLQGGLGELPVINMIEVQVAKEDTARAQEIISAYEAGEFTIDDDTQS